MDDAFERVQRHALEARYDDDPVALAFIRLYFELLDVLRAETRARLDERDHADHVADRFRGTINELSQKVDLQRRELEILGDRLAVIQQGSISQPMKGSTEALAFPIKTYTFKPQFQNTIGANDIFGSNYWENYLKWWPDVQANPRKPARKRRGR